MDIRWLRYFQKLARVGHMTKTAQELGIPQPHLSRVINRMEQELGFNLFQRVGRGIALTRAGQVFLEHIDRVLLEYDVGITRARQTAGIEENSLSIATTGATHLLGLLPEFLKKHPNIHLTQKIAPTEEIIQMLLEGRCDVAITYPPIDHPEIETKPLLTEEIVLVVAPNHHLASRQEIDLRELKEEIFVELIDNHSFRKLTDLMCEKAGFKPKVLFEGEVMLMAQLVEAGLGVALVPKSVLSLHPDFPVKAIPIIYPEHKLTVGISAPKLERLKPLAEKFIDFALKFNG